MKGEGNLHAFCGRVNANYWNYWSNPNPAAGLRTYAWAPITMRSLLGIATFIKNNRASLVKSSPLINQRIGSYRVAYSARPNQNGSLEMIFCWLGNIPLSTIFVCLRLRYVVKGIYSYGLDCSRSLLLPFSGFEISCSLFPSWFVSFITSSLLQSFAKHRILGNPDNLWSVGLLGTIRPGS